MKNGKNYSFGERDKSKLSSIFDKYFTYLGSFNIVLEQLLIVSSS